MHPSPLRRLFARTLRASLASPLVLAGCGSVDTTGYSAPTCENGRLAVSGLSPAMPTDFVQLRQRVGVGNSEDHYSEMEVSSSGTVCATASQPSTCAEAYRDLTSNSGFRQSCLQICTEYYLATTRGDDVTALTTLESLRGFLGSIDTAQEAVLLAFAQGYDVSCDTLSRGAVKADAAGGFKVIATQGFACGAGTELKQFLLNVSASGEVSEVSHSVLERGDPNCAIGRRPVGLRAREGVACTSALGHHFATAAHLEAASIQAFLRLYEELHLHGADEALRDSALVSAMDEVLHTDLSTRLAHRFGATPPRPDVTPLPLRPLFEVALDNAVEGCTRETYGALVAHHQALHARDAELRTVMARIAEDETRHAELSWAVERWALTRLSDAERSELREARRRAVEVLRQEVAEPLEAELVTEAGLPSPELAMSWVSQLERDLWA